MKKLQEVKELKIQRPPRKKISEQEALQRMKEFSQRREQFIAIVRTGQSGSVSS
jgi:hypothetical protein